MRKYFQYLDLRNDSSFPSFIMLSIFDVTMFSEVNQDLGNDFDYYSFLHYINKYNKYNKKLLYF